MIKVELGFSQTIWRFFCINGHAGSAPRGQDIVCAAVSAIAQTAVLGLVEVVGIEPELTMESGNLSCVLPNGLSRQQQRDAAVVLNTMAAGLESVRLGNPKWMEITKMEVE